MAVNSVTIIDKDLEREYLMTPFLFISNNSIPVFQKTSTSERQRGNWPVSASGIKQKSSLV